MFEKYCKKRKDPACFSGESKEPWLDCTESSVVATVTFRHHRPELLTVNCGANTSSDREVPHCSGKTLFNESALNTGFIIDITVL